MTSKVSKTLLASFARESSPAVLIAEDIPAAYSLLVPEYASRSYSRGLVIEVKRYDSTFGDAIHRISPKRAENRVENYLIPEEIARVANRLDQGKESSIRFGRKKDGKGYHGDRGDFCLVAGAMDGRNLSLMYRSLELIGGFAYDLALINALGKALGVEWKSLRIFAAHANVFALKRNSNEKLYPKLRKVFYGTHKS